MESLKKPGPLQFLVSKAHHHLASRVFEQMGLNRGPPPVLFELGFMRVVPRLNWQMFWR